MSKESNEHHFISIENAERIAEEYAAQQSEDMAVRFKERIEILTMIIMGEIPFSDDCVHGYSDDKFCDSKHKCKNCLNK